MDGWCTPAEVVVPLREFYGGRVWTDPASNENSIVNAVIEYTFGGLHLPWLKETYENCPFSKAGAWTNKGLEELKSGRCTELVRLTMVATSTAWWSKMARFRRNPRFIFTKRLKFRGDKKTPQHGAMFDTVLTYFGPRCKAFDKHFAHLARWSAWGR